MMFGVMFTSVAMDNLNMMLKSLKEYNSSTHDYHGLYLFLATVQKFNDNKPLSEEHIARYTKYFQHRWAFDKWSALSEQRFLDVLPVEV